MTKSISKNGTFLPTGYKVPDKSKQFMKLTPGDNVIRALSTPLIGWVIFTEDKKPIRRHMDEGEFTREDMRQLKAKKKEDGDFESAKHFWFLLVWDYNAKAPKCLEITQVSVLKPLYSLVENPKWGDPRKYDININRVGTGKNDTEFTVTPEPHSPLLQETEDAIAILEESKLLDLDAIWKGEYPFEIYNW